MESVSVRIDVLRTALDRLDESLSLVNDPSALRYHTQIRDSVIQRLEFSVDIFWKCLKEHLEKKHGVIIASPKGVFRECLAQQIVNAQEFATLIAMIEDRNETSHRYDEVMAKRIVQSAFGYRDIMLEVVERIGGDHDAH